MYVHPCCHPISTPQASHDPAVGLYTPSSTLLPLLPMLCSVQSHQPPGEQNCTPPTSNSALTSSGTPHQNPSGTLFRPLPDTYHSLYHINKPPPRPHALRVEPAVLVIFPCLSPTTMTSVPTIPQPHSPRACVPDTVLRALYTLPHLTLTTTLGIIHYEQHTIPALGSVHYFIYIQMRE